MNFLGLNRGTAAGNSSGDTGDTAYSNDPLLGAYRDLTYLECRDIYRYWPLGKRIASALPNFAMSAQRKFLVRNAPREVNEKLSEVANELDLDEAVKKTAIYARIFGLASIFVATRNKKPSDHLSYKDIQANGLTLNVLDPLSMGGSIQIDNDSLSPTFGEPIKIKIQGKGINPQRIKVVFNDIPLYYKFNPSSFSFSGPSIYQNMTLLIRAWNRGIIAMQRLATKAAAMVKTTKDGPNVTGFGLRAAEYNLSLIRSIENDGIASIRNGDTLEFFNLTGVTEVDAIIQQMNTGLMMALSDTPSGILLDKNLSVGLNDGTEDMKAILMAVDNFRFHTLKPLYSFVDKFLCYKAFTGDFIMAMVEEYPDLYRGKSATDVLTEWLQNYTFEWGELYPQNENEKADTESKLLDNLIKIQALGAESSSLGEALNQLGLFETDFVLKEAPMGEGEFFNSNDGEDEDGDEFVDDGVVSASDDNGELGNGERRNIGTLRNSSNINKGGGVSSSTRINGRRNEENGRNSQKVQGGFNR